MNLLLCSIFFLLPIRDTLLMPDDNAKRGRHHPIGPSYLSPVKRRDKRKSTTYVQPLGYDAKRLRLEEELRMLQKPISLGLTGTSKPPVTNEPPGISDDLANLQPSSPEQEPSGTFHYDDIPFHDDIVQPEDAVTKPRRTVPDQTAITLYERWKALLPRLVDPYLEHFSRTIGKPLRSITSLDGRCSGICGGQKKTPIRCLFHDRKCCISS